MNPTTTNKDFQKVSEDNFLMISNSFDTVRLWSDLKVNEINLLTAIMLEIAKQTGKKILTLHIMQKMYLVIFLQSLSTKLWTMI